MLLSFRYRCEAATSVTEVNLNKLSDTTLRSLCIYFTELIRAEPEDVSFHTVTENV